MSRTAVVAFGGNALVTDAEHDSIPEQYQTVRRTVPHLAEMYPGRGRRDRGSGPDTSHPRGHLGNTHREHAHG